MRYKYTIFVESVIINEIRQKIRQILYPAACRMPGQLCAGQGAGVRGDAAEAVWISSGPLEKIAPQGVGLEFFRC